MFVYPTFDVETRRKVDGEQLDWPEPGDASDESGLGCNREYIDLRRLSWAEAKRVLALERRLAARIESAADTEEEWQNVEEELSESDQHLYGLDLGVASTVVSLSAAKCVPFSSCNGGAFGGQHHEIYPLVTFYARVQMLELLMASAEEADIGLDGGTYLIAYANDVRKMWAFAESIISRSPQFNALRTRRAQRPKENTNAGQYDLPFN